MTASSLAREKTSRLSPSNIGMWLDCQMRWRFVYVEDLKRPPAAALEFGTSWDKAISDQESGFWAEYLIDGKPLTSSQMADKFAAIWDEHAALVEDWGDDNKDSLLDIGVTGAELWVPQVGVHWEPLTTQKEFQIGLKSGEDDNWAIQGIMDSVLMPRGEYESVIFDEKTAKQSWLTKDGKPTRKATANLQKCAYTLGAKVDLQLAGKVNPNKMVFDVLVKTKTPKVQVVEVEVSDTEQDAYLHIAEAARFQQQSAIDSGFFIPNRQSNMCSKRWCAFHEQCVKEHGGEVPE